MKGTLSELHRRGDDVQRKGWTNNFLHFLIESLWRDEIWVKKLIFIFAPQAQKQADWNQINNEQPDFIKNKPEIPGIDNTIEVYIDFLDTTEFVFTAPYAMKFTAQTSEGADATLDPVLDTNLAQYDDVTITPAEAGLIILTGTKL
jgi:hypothetical protein